MTVPSDQRELHIARPPLLASLAVAVACLLMGWISAMESRHVSVTHGFPLDWFTVLASTTPRWIFLAIVLPFVLQLAVRVPLIPLRVPTLLLHLSVLAVISIAHAALDGWAMKFTAPAITMMFGAIPRLLRSWYNTLPTVASMWAAVHCAAWGMHEARERQRRTLRASQLEAQLQTARLAALRAQLQPHFLYNTLNSIAALVAGVQPTRAVAAIEQLGELLQASLRDDGREEIPIAEEVALAERYLALQHMRFGERLRYTCEVATGVAEVLVPVLILQPIIENAVVHGLDAGQDILTVRVEANATPDGMEILVVNDGPPLPTSDGRNRDRNSNRGHGVGVSTTRARLITVHGDHASLTLATNNDHGVTARIYIPHAHPTRTPLTTENAVAAVR